jgi:hypothetical protein
VHSHLSLSFPDYVAICVLNYDINLRHSSVFVLKAQEYGGLALGFEPSKVWGFTKIPRTIKMVAGEGFEPSKVWGFTKIPRTLNYGGG